MLRRFAVFFGVMATVQATAMAQWDSGSDGTDGAFNPAASLEVDLGMAASLCDCDGDTQVDDECGWDCPSPVAGLGVYDRERWAVVFKYSTIDVPAGVIVTFKNHPSGAPVVWLSQGNVTINGIVNLDGQTALATDAAQTRREGGPGGWAGGQPGHSGMALLRSTGHGPGATNYEGVVGSCADAGAPASHVALAGGVLVNSALSKIYDNQLPYASPLHGGSGGGTSSNIASEGGGGGGGAILIACGEDDLPGMEVLSLGTGTVVRALGGSGATGGEFGGGGGSGGTIRLRAEQLSVAAGSALDVRSGLRTSGCDNNRDANGRVRIEFDVATNGLPTFTGETALYVPQFVNVASPLFPPIEPMLRIVSIDGVAAPDDPLAGILTTDLAIDDLSAVVVAIEAENLPAGNHDVQVRVTPARGGITTATATLTESGGVWSGSTTVTFAQGRSEVQLRWPVP
jgi:hypothetical protein